MTTIAKSTKKMKSKHLKSKTDESKKIKEVKKIEKLETKKQKSKTSKETDNSKDSDNSSSEDEAEDMEATMKSLKEDDPDFYKYLEENDKDLLGFTATNPLDAISDEDDDDDDNDNDEKSSNKKNIEDEIVEENETNSDKTELTLALVREWKKTLQGTPSFKHIRKIVTAFKAAVNLNNEEITESSKYSVTDPKAFQELMFMALKDLPSVIQKMNPYQIIKGSRSLQVSKNTTKLSSILKFHAASLLVLLNDINNTETAALVLHSLNQLLPYFLSYRRTLKELIKAVIIVWASSKDVETQIATFAFLHNASKEFKKSILELVLKTIYSIFIKGCRNTNIRTMPLINFQKNSAAELFNIDQVLSYQICFESIRQLAISLRNVMTAITKKTHKSNSAESYKLVYNWQFCHSLDFWSRVLSSASNVSIQNKTENALSELVYPLIQVTIGTIRLNPTAQYASLRFYLIRSLIRLTQNTNVVIPIFSLLSEMLTSTAFTRNPKKTKGNLVAFDFDHNIKCSQGYLGTKIYQDGLTEQFVELIGEYFVLYSKSITFPEFITPVVITLRRFIKSSKNVRMNKQLMNMVEKLNNNGDFISKKRATADFTPSDTAEVANFLKEISWKDTPLGSFVAVQREVKEEKARIVRESIEEEDKETEEDLRRKEAKKLGLDLDDDDDAVDIEMSE
ncbi:hypothetical protein TBLA_0B04180 [Henningerozyma blattae CBS 6284]|uniref:Nucleolar complex protein 2 n=1 Tax=Henningerozyma blattae (strain ATCC 34711 / CBS 6284 / DSM 70876 / NBRC 10599 / NRRL Y-10934 / UCD 77-7) TaxID=1071380 RepID=I2GYQ4_HENB6|nr:hypothetical protein TBLA_0B04180 [Tetrapisispora blattae CBS 6284]CCH59256.1 hypothetical protein TBLA_0B04180 [Tetrapisispora blattae CBS 6284]